MTGKERDTRRMWPGGRAAAIGVTVAAAMLGPSTSALASPRPLPAAPPASAINRTGQAADPLTAQSATPVGWAPVPYRNAQLSVPGSWLVETPQQLSCGFGQTRGMIFAGAKPEIPKGTGCGLTRSLAWILPAGHLPPGIGHRKPTAVINGIPVYRLTSGLGSVRYLVPELGVRIGARGRLARRLLATLTRSPLSVVLRRGPARPVPASWTWRRFGGVRFASPASWSLQRESQWATCGTGLAPGTLLLINATKAPEPLPCPYSFPTASADQAQPGLTVVSGKYAAESVSEMYIRCRPRHGARLCLASITGQGGLFGSVLIFRVSRPHRPTTFFVLGLSGSGARARAIFGSIRAARR